LYVQHLKIVIKIQILISLKKINYRINLDMLYVYGIAGSCSHSY